jgi:hypothetical protein
MPTVVCYVFKDRFRCALGRRNLGRSYRLLAGSFRQNQTKVARSLKRINYEKDRCRVRYGAMVAHLNLRTPQELRLFCCQHTGGYSGDLRAFWKGILSTLALCLICRYQRLTTPDSRNPLINLPCATPAAKIHPDHPPTKSLARSSTEKIDESVRVPRLPAGLCLPFCCCYPQLACPEHDSCSRGRARHPDRHFFRPEWRHSGSGARILFRLHQFSGQEHHSDEL